MAVEEKTATPSPDSGHFLIKAQNIGLQVRTVKQSGRQNGATFGDLVKNSLRSRASIFKRAILKDLSFEVMPGERIGLIGPNGAGKSTLLLMLNGALRNSSGTLQINGRTHALMNVRLGMKIRATGIENIFLNAYRLGYKTKDVKALIEEIADFSELGDQIREPVSTYSAGMQLRLAFAIATSIKPEILLMDEWVGAGDQRFRRKAQDRLSGVLESSRALVIASHNEALIRNVCNKVIYLENGSIRFFGDIDEGYQLFNAEQDGPPKPAAR